MQIKLYFKHLKLISDLLKIVSIYGLFGSNIYQKLLFFLFRINFIKMLIKFVNKLYLKDLKEENKILFII